MDGYTTEEIDHAALEPRQGNGANKRKVDQTRFAFSGATAAICGTFAAIASIPDDPRPRGHSSGQQYGAASAF